MKEIQLSQGKIALVDDEDYERVNKYKWYYKKRNENYGAARSNLVGYMHRFILNTTIEIDYINGNPLDNRKTNLRLCSHAENMCNMSKHTDNKSGYKGVFWSKRSNKYQVQIMVRGKKIHLGLFTDLQEAAKAYNIAALEYFNKFSKLNKL